MILTKKATQLAVWGMGKYRYIRTGDSVRARGRSRCGHWKTKNKNVNKGIYEICGNVF